MSGCTVEGCEGSLSASGAGRGWCPKHYSRWKRHGDPLATKQRQVRLCDVEGCSAKHASRGFCRKHLQRWYAHGDPLKVAKPHEGRQTCLRGHQFDGTRRHKNGRVQRTCSTCLRDATREWMRAQRPERHCECGVVLVGQIRVCDGCREDVGRRKIPLTLRRAVLERDGYRCLACKSTDDLHMDHIWPVVLGGVTAEANLQTLCGPCNIAKGATYVDHRPGDHQGQLAFQLAWTNPRAAPLIERVHAKAEYDGDCLIWQGATSSNGTPMVTHHQQTSTVMRALWIEVNGELESGQNVRRTCGKKPCVAVGHLEAYERSRRR